MKTNEQMLEDIEQRCMGWTLDTRVPGVLTALSRVPDLPADMERQEQILNSLAAKADLYGRLREALNFFTRREITLRIETGPNAPAINNVALPPGEAASAASDKVIERLITELNRLEKEITGANVDWAGILRFLRQKL